MKNKLMTFEQIMGFPQKLPADTVGFIEKWITADLCVMHRYLHDGSYHEAYAHRGSKGKWIYIVGFESSQDMMGAEGLFDSYQECFDFYQNDCTYA